MREAKQPTLFVSVVLTLALAAMLWPRAAVADEQQLENQTGERVERREVHRESLEVPLYFYNLYASQFQNKQQKEALEAWNHAHKAWLAYQDLAANKQKKISPYWIGVQCEPVAETPLLSDLPGVGKVFRKGGLKVTAVVADSPAEKAGMKIGDSIITAGDAEMKELGDLLVAVGKAKENELQLQIIRDEKPKTLRVTPLKRPATARDERIKWTDSLLNRRSVTEWPLHFTPMVTVQKLPHDVELTLHKKGDSAAKITVKRGDQTWNVGENELDKLPADVRGFVQQLLSATKVSRIRGHNFGYPFGTNSWRQSVVVPSHQVKPNVDATERKLKEISKRLEQLQVAVDELKRER